MSSWNIPHQHKLDKGVRHDRELVRRIGVVGGFVKEVWLTPEEDEKESSPGVDQLPANQGGERMDTWGDVG